MGHTTTQGFAEMLGPDDEVALRRAVGFNLQTNHYPPLPGGYVGPVVEAIYNCRNERGDLVVALPEGIDPTPRQAFDHDGVLHVRSDVLVTITHSWPFVEGYEVEED